MWGSRLRQVGHWAGSSQPSGVAWFSASMAWVQARLMAPGSRYGSWGSGVRARAWTSRCTLTVLSGPVAIML
ncbi:hypothetical protein GCM10027456_78540 [Kineosporia babensis]